MFVRWPMWGRVVVPAVIVTFVIVMGSIHIDADDGERALDGFGILLVAAACVTTFAVSIWPLASLVTP